MSILFDEICINEEILQEYTYFKNVNINIKGMRYPNL